MRLRTLSIALMLAYAPLAHADPHAYRGPHPIDLEGHWDLEGELHMHDDLIVGVEPFAEVEGALVFLGDPIAYGWDGEAWLFRGAHPLPLGLGHGYCGIPGEHVHAFAPEGSYRRESSGALVYTGVMRGGVPLVRPERLQPRTPIAGGDEMPVLGAIGTTFFFRGCLHTVVVGIDGVPVAVPTGDCVLRAARPPPPAARVLHPTPHDYPRIQANPNRIPVPRSTRSQR